MAEEWEHRLIKVNLTGTDPSKPQPVVVFDSLLGSNAAPQTPGTPRPPEIIYYLNSPEQYGGRADFTHDWEICGVIPLGSMAHILLKRRK